MGTTLMRFIEARFSIHVMGLKREYCCFSGCGLYLELGFWDFNFLIETSYSLMARLPNFCRQVTLIIKAIVLHPTGVTPPIITSTILLRKKINGSILNIHTRSIKIYVYLMKYSYRSHQNICVSDRIVRGLCRFHTN